IADAIAVDSSGNAYVTGYTDDSSFPSTVGTFPSGGVVFVTKLNATGTALVYSTYLGGSGVQWGTGIAVDSAGNAYVQGSTSASNFPTLGAFQNYNAGNQDAFITKLDATGTILYSSYLGGSGADGSVSPAASPNIASNHNIAVDSAGNVYIV